MTDDLLLAARSLGACTHINAFGDVVRPAEMGSAGITYLRGDLDIALELLSRVPGGGVKISCGGKNLKFTVMLDEHTPVHEYSDLSGAAIALAQLISALDDRVVARSACA